LSNLHPGCFHVQPCHSFAGDPGFYLMQIRLDQLLSRYGYCSRREAAGWVKAGVVTAADGAPFLRADEKADPRAVLVHGQPVPFPEGMFIALHKPAGCTCSHNPAEAPLLYDLLPPAWLRRNPAPETAGRLDRETSGLILLSDDGAFLHRWTSPRHEVPKVYEATVDADFPPGLVELFAAGTLLLHGEEKPCRAAVLEITGDRTARLTVTEGKYHQVRRMFASQGCRVTALHRTAAGGIELGSLAPGEWRELTVEERAG
jgi:16S rRNA pseudouridine516 synthase